MLLDNRLEIDGTDKHEKSMCCSIGEFPLMVRLRISLARTHEEPLNKFGLVARAQDYDCKHKYLRAAFIPE